MTEENYGHLLATHSRWSLYHRLRRNGEIGAESYMCGLYPNCPDLAAVRKAEALRRNPGEPLRSGLTLPKDKA